MYDPLKPRKRRARNGPSATTLKDVADIARVSEVTVSRILRNKGYISDETRARVMEAIREVGYLPNRIAGTLASASSNLVGVIIPSMSNIVFPEVLQGVHLACAAAGLQPIVGITDYDPDQEEKLVTSLLTWQPTALLVAGADHTEVTRQLLRTSRIRVAQLMEIDCDAIDVAVGLSHIDAGRDTGRHLLARGYRRFGYVRHDFRGDQRARRRYDGLSETLAVAGLSIVDEIMFKGPSSAPAGRAMTAELLARSPNIDVVVFSNDDLAIGGVFHCLAHNIALKTQLGLFGFNGLEIGQTLPVPLSTIRSNRFLIGRSAIEKILEQQTRPDAPIVIDTGYEIVEGGTA